jgi:NADPH-dependent 2,4-dienoyl-CoA reductase/sulfur reductase-like enzyme
MKSTGDVMEKYEIMILGDGRESVVCAQSAGMKYPGKSIAILVSNFQCFFNKVSSLFFFLIEEDNEGDFQLLLNSNKIKVLIDEALDRKGHKLYLKSGRIILFEKLVLAQGCQCPTLPIKGINKEGIYYLKTNFDQLVMIKQLALSAENIIIYGGSYIGVKLADELLNRDKKVTIIEKSAWLLPETIDLSLGREVTELLAGQGCKVILNRRIKSIIGETKISAVELSASEKIACDILLISCKSKPNIQFAQKLGLICDSDRGILVDEYSKTSERDVFAVGECAAHFEFFRGDLADAILSSTYELEGIIVGANLYSVIYNRENLLENLYTLNSVF